MSDLFFAKKILSFSIFIIGKSGPIPLDYFDELYFPLICDTCDCSCNAEFCVEDKDCPISCKRNLTSKSCEHYPQHKQIFIGDPFTPITIQHILDAINSLIIIYKSHPDHYDLSCNDIFFDISSNKVFITWYKQFLLINNI